jgi:hypothetical protein
VKVKELQPNIWLGAKNKITMLWGGRAQYAIEMEPRLRTADLLVGWLNDHKLIKVIM